MKHIIAQLITVALQNIIDADAAAITVPDKINVERTRDPQHGDLATNIAMMLAKPAGIPPRQLAELIVTHFPSNANVSAVEIAGPGFINFRLVAGVAQQVIVDILDQGDQYGHTTMGQQQKVLLEFISANPTGPLHVGHGRHAAYGASVAAILKATGHDVTCEYYINDAGRQMDILAVSLWLRYLGQCQQQVTFPTNAYKGDYIIDIAKDLFAQFGERFVKQADQVTSGLPDDEPDGGDKEIYIDAVGVRAKELLGDDYVVVLDFVLNAVLGDIKNDLAEFGVHFDNWFSERSLAHNGTVEQALEKLQQHKSVVEKDGALWFKATDYGDDKDRVVRRANGQNTYFASDIAYHLNKRQRGFEVLLDILGSDHHGYVSRVRAGLQAMGEPGDSLEVRLMQFVSLYRNGERISMTTRGGDFVSLRKLREEVGNDAARFFYVMRSNDQHLDFDLDLAKTNREVNPVFYLQYGHARVCRIMRRPELQAVPWDQDNGRAHLAKLSHAKEEALLMQLSRFPEVLQLAAKNRAPQAVGHYLRELTASFHSFYNDCKVLCDDKDLKDARLALAQATAQVLRNGLSLLGVSAPQRM